VNKKIIFAAASLALCIMYIKSKKPIKPITTNFYDIDFLRNSAAVEKVLKNEGFFEVDLTTGDNININTIMLDQSTDKTVTATILSCPGFFPGRKEGMSTLYTMLKEHPYNFMFIDCRGHGKSTGEFLTLNGIKHYGESEFLDIVAAIEFISNYNKEHNIPNNIIIHGLCSGAFHSVKAITNIKKTNQETYKSIKGMILDSAWPAISDIAESSLRAEAITRCKHYKIPALQSIAEFLLIQTYRLLFKNTHSAQEPLTNIINEIDQPILFIHAQDDIFVPIDHIKPLINISQKPELWRVTESGHVHNHLKQKDSYKKRIEEFISKTLD